MRHRRRNHARHWTVAGSLALAAGLAASWYYGFAAPPARSPAPGGARLALDPASPRRAAPGQPPGLHPGSTTLATVRGSSPRYAAPRVRAPGQVPAWWRGAPSVLPVVAARPGWVRVRLAQRPDGSESWLPARDVTLSSTRYLIVINRATRHLTLYSGGRQVFSAPAGIGAVGDPTPAGHYFVAFAEPPPQPGQGYGPFILVTSAHSPAISDWAGSGDAVIGIHGPLGEGRLIGATGARISHGCIRLHVPALRKLRSVPPGTPIDISR